MSAKTAVPSVRYVVKDGHTLGYLTSPESRLMGVLASSVKLGGHNPKNGPVFVSHTQLRPATSDDFDFFRVVIHPDFQPLG